MPILKFFNILWPWGHQLLVSTRISPEFQNCWSPYGDDVGYNRFLTNPKTNETITNLSDSLKINPEGTRGPIGPVVAILEPWCDGHHACIKNFVDLTTSKSDLLFGRSIVPSFHLSSSIFQFSDLLSCLEPSTGRPEKDLKKNIEVKSVYMGWCTVPRVP